MPRGYNDVLFISSLKISHLQPNVAVEVSGNIILEIDCVSHVYIAKHWTC